MILETAYSINKIPIRLTEERWDKIVDKHPYMTTYYDVMLDTVEEPEYVLTGQNGSLIAVKTLGRQSYLHVYYRELGRQDGFIISAFIKTKIEKKKIIWRAEDQ